MSNRVRAIGAACVVALLVVAAGAARHSNATSARDAKRADAKLQRLTAARDYYRNLVEPTVAPEVSQDVFVTAGSGKGGKGIGSGNNRLDDRLRKNSSGFPPAAKQLGNLEQQAVKSGKNPRQIKQAKGTQTAKLLTMLVEFNEKANDDFSGWSRPLDYVTDDEEQCVTEPAGTVANGPLHNQLPNPAGTEDNYTFWVPDFNLEHYTKMLYSTTGLTDRVRTDLTGTDGKPGFDFRGRTLKNMYREMSRGAYDITGEVIGWVKVDHSQAWYGADSCAGGPSSDSGHPDNENGESQLVIDGITKFAAANPNFPWANYDVEDTADADGDGDLNEPDGIIDHFVVVHAGEGEEGTGGPIYGTYAIWSSASAVLPADGGYTIPGTNMKVFNYIMQPEDGAVGVFAHEYGHDLGLPDLYDTSGNGSDSDTDFWDLMSSGSHSGELNQLAPTHMGAWDKFVLGWTDPEVFEYGQSGRSVQVGQQSNPPVGTKDAVRVNLPTKVISLAEPHSGANSWWTNNDQDWADVKLSRTLDVPDGTDAKFRFWSNYIVEEDWDFDFVEVSTDGGTTWSQQKVFRAEDDSLASTDDGYTDPNGRLHDYGDLKYGLTGDSGGWVELYVDLSAYAGSTIGLRIRHATDAAFVERGAFYDDFSLVVDGTTSFSDDTENGANGWTSQQGTFTDSSGAGFIQHSGTFNFNHYYLAEWRNYDGFDIGLKYSYDTRFFNTQTGEWNVTFTPYNAPGMLVWYRDIQYGSVNHVTNTTTNLPSTGSKGALLVVDSHFDPARRTVPDGTTLRNMPSRVQSSNAAFNAWGTYPFTECFQPVATSNGNACTSVGALPGVNGFDDRNTYYPGIQRTATGGLAFRDIDASVVLPSKDNCVYTTRFVDAAGNLATSDPLWGVDVLGAGSVLGTGRPVDGSPDDPEDTASPCTAGRDLSFGVRFDVKNVGQGNKSATISVDPGPKK